NRERRVAAACAAAGLEIDPPAPATADDAGAGGHGSLHVEDRLACIGLVIVVRVLRDDPAVLPVRARPAVTAVGARTHQHACVAHYRGIAGAAQAGGHCAFDAGVLR